VHVHVGGGGGGGGAPMCAVISSTSCIVLLPLCLFSLPSYSLPVPRVFPVQVMEGVEIAVEP